MPITVKKTGKLFMKDNDGNFVQIMPESACAVPEYSGATATSGGVAGLVPAALSSQKDKYLKGDGTWAELILPDVYQGATEEANGIAGLVPAADSEDRDKFLCADGNWTTVDTSSTVHIEGSETVEGPKTFTQGPFATVVRNVISGNYTVNASHGQIFMLDLTGNATLSFTGVPENTGTTLRLYVNNRGSYSLTWPQTVVWNTSSAPSLTSNKMDVYELSTANGGKCWYASRVLSGIDKWVGDTMYINGKTNCHISLIGLTDASGSDEDPNPTLEWINNSVDISPNTNYTFSDIGEISYLEDDMDAFSAEITYENAEGEQWTLTIASYEIPGFGESDYSAGVSSVESVLAAGSLEASIFWNYIYNDIWISDEGDEQTYTFNCLVDSNGNRSYYSKGDVTLTFKNTGNDNFSITIRWTK